MNRKSVALFTSMRKNHDFYFQKVVEKHDFLFYVCVLSISSWPLDFHPLNFQDVCGMTFPGPESAS